MSTYEDEDDVEFTGKAIEFEPVTLRMGTIMTKLYIVDEENNHRELIGTYSSRERAEEVAHAIRWYSGSEDKITNNEYGPPIR